MCIQQEADNSEKRAPTHFFGQNLTPFFVFYPLILMKTLLHDSNMDFKGT
jgi:hypothetical protein